MMLDQIQYFQEEIDKVRQNLSQRCFGSSTYWTILEYEVYFKLEKLLWLWNKAEQNVDLVHSNTISNLLKRVHKPLRTLLVNKDITLQVQKLDSFSFTSLYTQWEILSKALTVLLFNLTKKTASSSQITIKFLDSKTAQDLPQYEIALKNWLFHQEKNLSHLWIILECGYLSQAGTGLYQVVENINWALSPLNGTAKLDSQQSVSDHVLPEVTGLVKKLQPILILTIPYKVGEEIQYRNWASEALEETHGTNKPLWNSPNDNQVIFK